MICREVSKIKERKKENKGSFVKMLNRQDVTHPGGFPCRAFFIALGVNKSPSKFFAIKISFKFFEIASVNDGDLEPYFLSFS